MTAVAFPGSSSFGAADRLSRSSSTSWPSSHGSRAGSRCAIQWAWRASAMWQPRSWAPCKVQKRNSHIDGGDPGLYRRRLQRRGRLSSPTARRCSCCRRPPMQSACTLRPRTVRCLMLLKLDVHLLLQCQLRLRVRIARQGQEQLSLLEPALPRATLCSILLRPRLTCPNGFCRRPGRQAALAAAYCGTCKRRQQRQCRRRRRAACDGPRESVLGLVACVRCCSALFCSVDIARTLQLLCLGAHRAVAYERGCRRATQEVRGRPAGLPLPHLRADQPSVAREDMRAAGFRR